MAKKRTALSGMSQPKAEEIVKAVQSETPPPQPKKDRSDWVRINVSVPPDIHKAFKVKAFSNEESHQEILLRAIIEYTQK